MDREGKDDYLRIIIIFAGIIDLRQPSSSVLMARIIGIDLEPIKIGGIRIRGIGVIVRIVTIVVGAQRIVRAKVTQRQLCHKGIFLLIRRRENDTKPCEITSMSECVGRQHKWACDNRFSGLGRRQGYRSILDFKEGIEALKDGRSHRSITTPNVCDLQAYLGRISRGKALCSSRLNERESRSMQL